MTNTPLHKRPTFFQTRNPKPNHLCSSSYAHNKCMCTYVDTHVNIEFSLYYIYADTYTYTYIHTYIRTHITTYTYIYTHTHTHTHIHTYIHTYLNFAYVSSVTAGDDSDSIGPDTLEVASASQRTAFSRRRANPKIKSCRLCDRAQQNH